ncbi:hypothetical protein DACRYDRAFT_109326 [Dacryopinax primogenitus]|uniref:Uncharacterized protein n=1 Tax=Dacryopinax primogenitus (strain DJM 731) TaxID=1858805 RepID=M5G1X7_DACPD|nr:uncharacterized protein DACRYDRAFT_109326 [Dacryopinax primogenitus]EJT99901.1 hypothetical protein DACRYDRAFT_109326 [Dacryopinax primogenitus]
MISCGRSPVLMDVHVYRVEEWERELEETEEMLPKWHSTLPSAQTESVCLPSIPFDNMWPDDELRLPLFAKKSFVGGVDFNKPLDDEKNSKMEDGPVRKWWFAEGSLDSMKA